jgi:hypothetical protein
MTIKDMPDFGTKKEKIKWLITNKERLIKMAKEQIKHADAISFSLAPNKVSGVSKANGGDNKTEVTVKAVINTTNLMDGHDDVHLPGLWDKSLNENKMIMHLQEHQMRFDKIISDMDDLKAYVKFFSWNELGFSYEGQTQALMFDSNVIQQRNPFMFDQYRKGYVKNHSVGMRYVKLILAVNDEDWGAEYEAWEKYYKEIVNKERADEKGYFWVVKEAKVIEGSAVPLGSNWATPTVSVKNEEPPEGTPDKSQPSEDTEQLINAIKKSFKSLKI